MTIGERIKKRRQELGLTQSELAERMGYTSRAAICTVEKDKEDLTTTRIRRFAEALHTTPSYLMGWEDIAYADVESTNDHIDVYKYDPEKFEKAMALYDKYLEASPDIKTVVETLLKPAPKEA